MIWFWMYHCNLPLYILYSLYSYSNSQWTFAKNKKCIRYNSDCCKYIYFCIIYCTYTSYGVENYWFEIEIRQRITYQPRSEFLRCPVFLCIKHYYFSIYYSYFVPLKKRSQIGKSYFYDKSYFLRSYYVKWVYQVDWNTMWNYCVYNIYLHGYSHRQSDGVHILCVACKYMYFKNKTKKKKQ